MSFSELHIFLFLSFLVFIHSSASELVPVYSWGSQRIGEPSPALQRLSQNSFQDDIHKSLKGVSRIVVFAEQSLSPEDFAQKDASGNNAFPNLSKAHNSAKVTYFLHVQNPIKALESSVNDVEEISIEKLEDGGYAIPDAKVVIINLNDASDNEQRMDMLKRHDELMHAIYNNLREKDENILALYTARHASWTGSGASHSRKIRELSTDANATVNKYLNNDTIMFYSSGDAVIQSSSGGIQSETTVTLNYDATNTTTTVNLTANGTDSAGVAVTVSFYFVNSTTGYWFLENATITHGENIYSENLNTTVFAPFGFSYTCGNQTFTNDTFSITFSRFQVEPVLYKSTYLTKEFKFNDPYNCVGFTTIPIWSGLFVTFILLLIMTFGLTMMMDIKTMDRFDDAKGKTITINTSE